MYKIRRHAALFAGTIIGLTLGLGAPLAQADVTVERRLRTSGFAGIGSSETTIVEKISGMKKRETAQVKMSGNTGRMTGDLATDRITDVQQGLVWRIDHRGNSYTETKLRPPSTGRGLSGGKETANAEKSGVRVLRDEITVNATGEKKTISGFECTHYVVTWITESEDSNTKEHVESIRVSDLWNTPETPEIKALQQDERNYTEAWRRKIGWGSVQPELEKLGLGAVAGMLPGGDDGVRKSAREAAAKIQGYTVASGTKWHMKSSGGDVETVESATDENAPKIPRGLSGFLAAINTGDGSGSGGEGLVYESYSEIEKISIAGLPKSDFTVPADYEKVLR